MSISITVAPTVKFQVKGSIKDETGADKSFTFGLTCNRIEEEAITERMSGFTGSITNFAVEFLESAIIDWSEVLDDSKKPVPYSADAWRQLCRIPGLPVVALAAYRQESGAKAKN